ncbi:hypothetical protein [Nocardia macrotermitis]|uniref:Uncharacterized protein n=1 Tax=Nocardia macrotermitis TaxID=2585198 RepID=A0A7K0D994_9NOCA|nr:hypothetical protein [Nocardia macrotermitis]MQY21892.1 hypothetical protein [Nocardia macrotermitis]
MHWDQMTATPDDLRKRATRLRRGVGQLGVIESILDAADGPWLGVMDADGRGTAELRMHLAGRYRLTAVVTSAGKLSLIQMHAPTVGERVISGKPALRQGWDENVTMPKQPEWLDYVIDWVGRASADVDRRTVIAWQLEGADRRLAAMDDTLEGMRASLAEREQLRDELATEIHHLRTEFATLPEPPTATTDSVVTDHPADPETVAPQSTVDIHLTESTPAAPEIPGDPTDPDASVSALPTESRPGEPATAVIGLPSSDSLATMTESPHPDDDSPPGLGTNASEIPSATETPDTGTPPGYRLTTPNTRPEENTDIVHAPTDLSSSAADAPI